MKKILILTSDYPPQIGGIASYIYNFAAHWPGEVAIYAPRVAGDKQFDDQNSWKVYRRKQSWWLWPRWLRALFQVWRIVRQDRPDEIQLHQVLPLGYVGWFVKKIAKIPFVVVLHGTDLELAWQKKLKRKWLSFVLKTADKIVVNSKFLKNKLEQRLEKLPPVVVFYPCPGDQFFKKVAPAEIEAERRRLAIVGKQVILSVARFTEGKGFPHLLHLLPEILKDIPNLVWLIIGAGPKEKLIREMVEKNSLQNVVRFLGPIAYNDLPRYYQLADAFVLLTHKDDSSEEGWGTVFLEASASGLPVVAGRVGGVEETVKDLQTGILVDVYQPQAVVRTIIDLLSQLSYAKNLGDHGRMWVEQELSWDKQINKLID
ncbi:MAG: hypothetical protein A2538_05030 [Candidatus Magasanikbacteria bacterium RIFOXYD2_FULL_41_14]|uniref:Glycosyltransferase subfamily 4-like N-terminal domain-containing protein n=1 Tax=Candidatus Magasanikbacteria bacterium RIFOXYD2_FULL_41_14 TaxID=1798709 RepID=A0A1F6PFX2_9BACT|nr:MAG: hypothetical protein A2538_05030 [Candidatus Magasanikbacteria bacterium RIFOXYD2_FULL_41_14]